ncbi:hypothetical protein CLV91_1896 [Maribacter vaceletii]|uniref:Uncharacterized protein n=1 Tax=Maribacter vaceletii TaxID=1206816 RepID=A0A495E930_9FLAO|nr:hypothetical protein [Maribacter vaceletii]RKR13181.1 hypothetical protein CLV91_1896 [Maribacter vaceletii]
MIFKDIHSKLHAIATVGEEDTFISVIPRKKRIPIFFGNIPKNTVSIANSKTIKKTNAVQLSLFS